MADSAQTFTPKHVIELLSDDEGALSDIASSSTVNQDAKGKRKASDVVNGHNDAENLPKRPKNTLASLSSPRHSPYFNRSENSHRANKLLPSVTAKPTVVVDLTGDIAVELVNGIPVHKYYNPSPIDPTLGASGAVATHSRLSSSVSPQTMSITSKTSEAVGATAPIKNEPGTGTYLPPNVQVKPEPLPRKSNNTAFLIDDDDEEEDILTSLCDIQSYVRAQSSQAISVAVGDKILFSCITPTQIGAYLKGRTQIGQLDAALATVVAPLLFKSRISIDGKISGLKDTTGYPVKISLWVKANDEDDVRRVFAQHGYRLPIKPVAQPAKPSLPQLFPTNHLSAAVSANMPQPSRFPWLSKAQQQAYQYRSFLQQGLLPGHPAPSQPSEQPEPIWQVLLSGATQLNHQSSQTILDTLGMGVQDLAQLKEAPTPPGLKTELLKYQKQGLAWMLEKENPKDVSAGSASQFWEIRTDQFGTYYFNLASNCQSRQKPQLWRGGILADDMGLGKTIQTISLLLSDPSGNGIVESPSPVNPNYSNSSLIVCPLSVIGNWVGQIRTHVERSRLRIFVFHGQNKLDDVRELMRHDVVITTYATMAGSAVLQRMKWRRVILDEGHIIRNRSTRNHKAACELEAERKWVLTGTPIHNRLDDLHSLFRFIGTKPFDENDIWRRLIDQPIKSRRQVGMERLRNLMAQITLRRTKSMKIDGKSIIELPPCKVIMHTVEFRPDERAKYDALETQAREMFTDFFDEEEGTLRNNPRGPRNMTEFYSCMLALLTRLRQCCDHPDLVKRMPEIPALNRIRSGEIGSDDEFPDPTKEPESNNKLELTEENVERLLSTLEENREDECSICLEILKKPCITACGHLFCLSCISDVFTKQAADSKPASCPICRAKLTQEEVIVDPRGDDDDSEGSLDEGSIKLDDDIDLYLPKISGEGGPSRSNFLNQFEEDVDETFLQKRTSSKIDALLQFLRTKRRVDPDSKSVVFSSFTSMLDLIEGPLNILGFKFVRLDGKMSRAMRDESIALFEKDPSVHVILISLMCGSLGLNLTAASNCFLVDPWWNPQIEQQAIDRVYRLGQTKEVTIVRFIMKSSVEERVVKRQEEKRQLASEALNDPTAGGLVANNKTREERARDRLRDIRFTLFGE